MNERFWDLTCAGLPLVAMLFGLNVVLFVMLLLTIPFVEPGTRAFYTSAIGGVVILVSLVGSGTIIRRCRQR